MNAPKLHHYVPQFYLRHFTDAGGAPWVWDKQKDRTFPTLPNSVAAGTQIYRLTQYEADGHDPLTLEKQLSDLESQVSGITSDWIGRLGNMDPLDVVPIPQINRKIIALHLAIQYLRTADTREILRALMERDRGIPVEEWELREAHTELMWDEKTVELLAKRFRRSIWLFARNDSATPLITSDKPITFRTGDNRQWLRANFLSRETYLGFPLSPRIILYCYPRHGKWRQLGRFANCLSPVLLDDEMVESENIGQAFMATRFLFSNRDNFDDERAFATTIGTDLYAQKENSDNAA